MKFNSVGQTQTVDLQTGEANEVNIVVKCFAFHDNVYLVYLTSLQVYSLRLSHTGILSDGED